MSRLVLDVIQVSTTQRPRPGRDEAIHSIEGIPIGTEVTISITSRVGPIGRSRNRS